MFLLWGRTRRRAEPPLCSHWMSQWTSVFVSVWPTVLQHWTCLCPRGPRGPMVQLSYTEAQEGQNTSTNITTRVAAELQSCSLLQLLGCFLSHTSCQELKCALKRCFGSDDTNVSESELPMWVCECVRGSEDVHTWIGLIAALTSSNQSPCECSQVENLQVFWFCS